MVLDSESRGCWRNGRGAVHRAGAGVEPRVDLACHARLVQRGKGVAYVPCRRVIVPPLLQYTAAAAAIVF